MEAVPNGEQKPDPTAMKRFEREQWAYEVRSDRYNRNVALIAVSLAIVILVVSLVWLRHIFVLADGLLLGGIFTLLYGMARSFQSGETKFMFIVVTLGFIVALTLAYLKYIRPAQESASSLR